MAKQLTAKVYDQSGKKTGEKKLDPQVFAVEIKEDLVSQAVISQLSSSRRAIAHSKTRSAVRGGGKKPWRQKGTGRARHGSIRSPLWRGGGVTFGPDKNRNFQKRINKNAKKKAIKMILADKAANQAIVVLEQLKMEKPKTKEIFSLLKKLPVSQKSLLILAKASQPIYRSVNNIEGADTILADSLNAVALLKHDYLVIADEALKKISNTLAK